MQKETIYNYIIGCGLSLIPLSLIGKESSMENGYLIYLLLNLLVLANCILGIFYKEKIQITQTEILFSIIILISFSSTISNKRDINLFFI